MQKLTRLVLRHKRLVGVAWIVLTVLGMAASGTVKFDQRFGVPGKEGFETNQKIERTYGNGGENPPTLAVVSGADRGQVRTLEEKLTKRFPRARVAGYGSTGDQAFVSKDGRTAFIYAFPPRPTDVFGGNTKFAKDVRAELAGNGGVKVTGFDALQGSQGGGGGPGVLLEALLGGVGALLVLVFVFGSWLALVPLVMAISSILVTFLLLLGLTQITALSPVVQFLVALVGLGVSIDYALLVVVRWREERDKGLDNEDAITAAMGTAGRAVVFSGTTVAVGLLALVALPLPFMRSIGYGGLLIPLVATAVAITLLPVILAKMGPRLDRRRLRRRDNSDAAWRRWSAAVVRRRGLAAVVAVAILGVLLYSATGMNLGNADPNTIAKQGDAKDGLVALEKSGIGAGAIAPVETLSPTGATQAVKATQAKVDGVHGVSAPATAGWVRNGQSVVLAVPSRGDDSGAGRATVDKIRNVTSAPARVGGTGAENADFIDAVYGSFPLMIALIALVTFLLLARAFRSILLPIKAVVLNILSVGAAWGVLAFVWQNGHGSSQIWGIDPTGAIASWIPVMVFAFLYGLSMDYEVFILARMREEYDGAHNTDDAVITGLGRTGRLVTSAALILFLAFVSMASGPETDVKILATGLAAGILLDATVIRALLVPAVVSLMGRWNWWMPAGLARVLRVEPSPVAASETA
ncbi:MAG: MMPL family transporter [Actinomycetota bacterium]|nr:MMPL family transporter [Actinomycetota bacterium]